MRRTMPFATPAVIWRAFFVGTLLCGPGIGFAAGPNTSGSAPTPFVKFGQPDQAEGKKIWSELRRVRLEGYFEFQLRVMPRTQDEWTVNGRLWGGVNGQGTIYRLSLFPDPRNPATEIRWLLQNGGHPGVWRWSSAKPEVQRVTGDELSAPLIPGVDLTPFDLQMPFLYWTDYAYEGVSRFRSRPTYGFLLRPPSDFAAAHPAITGVRVQLDTQYNALVQIETVGAGNRVTKIMSLVDLQKTGEHWIPTFDFRDNTTRNKTRLTVTRAAPGLDFSAALFEPGHLDSTVSPPAQVEIVHLNP